MTMILDDLIAFLHARLEEDERIANDALCHRWEDDGFRWVLTGADDGVWSTWSTNGCMIEGIGISIEDEGGHTEGQAAHIVRHDPARVLRDIKAKRRLVALHADAHDCPEFISGTYPADWPGKAGQPWEHTSNEHHEEGEPCATLRLLALPYADHPDYRQEWV